MSKKNKVIEARAKFKDATEEVRESKTDEEGDSRKNDSQAKELLELCQNIELFISADYAEPFATVAHKTSDGTAQETLKLGSDRFSSFVRGRYYEKHKTATSKQALADAIDTLKAKAEFEGGRYKVNVRVASSGEDVLIDTGYEDHSRIRVSKRGYELLRTGETGFDENVKFVTPPNQQPLPAIPTDASKADFERIRGIFDIDDNAWLLLRAFAVYVLLPQTQYPILAIQGDAGSGKTELSKLITSLLDNQTPLVRSCPDSKENIAIQAKNALVLAYDNLSGMKAATADVFCQVATGGGFSTRKFYSQEEEVLHTFAKPVIFNGIDDISSREDLLDRAVTIHCNRITPEKRVPAKELHKKIEAEKPYIFAGLLSLVSLALQHLEETKITEAPRMADFAMVGSAIEKALGEQEGAFLRCMKENQMETLQGQAASDPLVQAILKLPDVTTVGYTATPTEAHKDISALLGPGLASKIIPSPKALSAQWGRIGEKLKVAGVEVKTSRSGQSRKVILQPTRAELAGDTCTILGDTCDRSGKAICHPESTAQRTTPDLVTDVTDKTATSYTGNTVNEIRI